MKLFVQTAVLLATFNGVLALPKDTAKETVARRTEDFFNPGLYLPSRLVAGGSASTTGANGGHNYGGNGANGGSINVNRPFGGGSANANGANGGTNTYGSGANGGTISIGRRAEEAMSAGLHHNKHVHTGKGSHKGASVTKSGGKDGVNVDGDGAHEGTISVGKREDDLFTPYFGWRGYQPYTVNGAITANGANGGTNYFGDGANGGRIAINRRENDAYIPNGWGYYGPMYYPAIGSISANGANGGYNYYGNGANDGYIGINKRELDNLPPSLGH